MGVGGLNVGLGAHVVGAGAASVRRGNVAGEAAIIVEDGATVSGLIIRDGVKPGG